MTGWDEGEFEAAESAVSTAEGAFFACAVEFVEAFASFGAAAESFADEFRNEPLGGALLAFARVSAKDCDAAPFA